MMSNNPWDKIRLNSVFPKTGSSDPKFYDLKLIDRITTEGQKNLRELLEKIKI